MKVMERRTQTIEKDGWENYWSLEKKYKAVEERLGCFPPKRHYRPLSNLGGCVVWERDWESYAKMEAAYEKMDADPESQELGKLPSGKSGERIELYGIATL